MDHVSDNVAVNPSSDIVLPHRILLFHMLVSLPGLVTLFRSSIILLFAAVLFRLPLRERIFPFITACQRDRVLPFFRNLMATLL